MRWPNGGQETGVRELKEIKGGMVDDVAGWNGCLDRLYEAVVLLGYAGSGKTSVQRMMGRSSRDFFYEVVSFTTRAPRAGEVDGLDYFFIGEDDFKLLRERGEFFEHAEHNGAYYATRLLENMQEQGACPVFVLNLAGFEQLRGRVEHLMGIWLHAREDIRRERLVARGDDPAAIDSRIAWEAEHYRGPEQWMRGEYPEIRVVNAECRLEEVECWRDTEKDGTLQLRGDFSPLMR